MYKKIDETVLTRLKEIVGEKNMLLSQEEMEPYSHDEVAELHHQPEVVVRVQSAEQISSIMKLAQEKRFPVTPRGAGYGLSGGAVPIHGGLVLSLEKMDKILEIDQENLMAVVEPGVITGNLHQAVEALGLFIRPTRQVSTPAPSAETSRKTPVGHERLNTA